MVILRFWKFHAMKRSVGGSLVLVPVREADRLPTQWWYGNWGNFVGKQIKGRRLVFKVVWLGIRRGGSGSYNRGIDSVIGPMCVKLWMIYYIDDGGRNHKKNLIRIGWQCECERERECKCESCLLSPFSFYSHLVGSRSRIRGVSQEGDQEKIMVVVVKWLERYQRFPGGSNGDLESKIELV